MVGKLKGLALVLLLWPVLAWGGQVTVEGVRMWPAPDNTRVVFDLSGPVRHNLFPLKNPERIVIDLRGAEMQADVAGLDLSESFLRDVRSAPRNGDDLRVVFDLKRDVQPKSFLLKPNRKYGHRLVIDLHDPEEGGKVVKKRADPSEPRPVIVAVDAGHGGEDPGASGRRGTKEKDVVLSIARRLASLIDDQAGMRAVLIRDGDYFISLRDRVRKARKHQADLFVSVHADAFPDRRARGASVYTLSRRGASSEHAQRLAAKENQSDLIGGVSLADKDDLLASVLLDLSMTATIEASTSVASQVLSQMDNIAHLHKRNVERAGFRVLKSPDLPSILVETAFISNPGEERKLRSSRYQYRMARAILGGIENYFEQNPPAGTIMAQRERKQTHTIARGDTLSEIARQYRVSLDSLRTVNDLRGDRIRVGQVLRIPSGG